MLNIIERQTNDVTILDLAGRNDEALAQCRADKTDTKNFEKWLADFKAGKM
jgi:putative IMPACT (imprinted ancient) family translation regulator